MPGQRHGRYRAVSRLAKATYGRSYREEGIAPGNWISRKHVRSRKTMLRIQLFIFSRVLFISAHRFYKRLPSSSSVNCVAEFSALCVSVYLV